MGKKVHVFSTLANDQSYNEFESGGGDMPILKRGVLIKGGTGVANSRLITPLGVVTEIDEEDLAMLEKNAVFQMHKKNGFITVRAKAADPEKVAADMNTSDPSAPRTPSHYIDEEDGVKVVDKAA